jgi:predicted short-subunit dehydrogenase-like oxidoreductase (DUF2520 family)
MNLLIVGRGKVGRGLERALRSAEGFSVATAGRRPSAAALREADVVVLAVVDEAIRSMAEAIAARLPERSVVLHCAGARGPEELEACARRGAATAVMHPLVSFPSTKKSPSLKGATFTISGAPRAVRAARAIARACGARVILGAGTDPAYHAAAALVANGAAALAFAGVSILSAIGFERRNAERAMAGLLRSVADNVAELGVPQALTGPIARGDAATIAGHRKALRRLGLPLLNAYDALGPVILQCARSAGLRDEQVSAIQRAFQSRN